MKGEPLTDLTVATMAWNRARVLLVRLRAARAECRCERCEREEPEVGFAGTEPCWKQWIDIFDGDRVRVTRGWCATCELRERIHLAFRAAMRVRGARQRVMQRLALRATRYVETA